MSEVSKISRRRRLAPQFEIDTGLPAFTILKEFIKTINRLLRLKYDSMSQCSNAVQRLRESKDFHGVRGLQEDEVGLWEGRGRGTSSIEGHQHGDYHVSDAHEAELVSHRIWMQGFNTLPGTEEKRFVSFACATHA